MRVGLVFGGRSVEHSVSLSSARTVAQGLREAGHEVVPLAVAQDGCWLGREASAAALDGETTVIEAVGDSVLSSLNALVDSGIEVLFPIVHGTWGEDGCLQGLAEMADLPYVGAGVTCSAVSMDKVVAKRQLEAAGVPVVEYRAFRRRRFEADPEGCVAELDALPLPLFVKPAVGGSSVGVRRVDDATERREALAFAFRFDDSVLVERGVRGRELECAVLGYGELEASRIGEIIPGKEFYDYEDKYLSDGAQLIAPAELDPAVEAELRRVAVEAFRSLGGWGMARVDFLLEGDRPYLNEINTLPGFTRISMYPRLWDLAGVPRDELVDRLVKVAVERHRDRQRLDLGIKSWLAEVARD